MNKFVVVAALALNGGIVRLSKAQADVRKHALQPVKGAKVGKDGEASFEIIKPVQFKIGETFGFEGNLPKQLAVLAEDAESAAAKAKAAAEKAEAEAAKAAKGQKAAALGAEIKAKREQLAALDKQYAAETDAAAKDKLGDAIDALQNSIDLAADELADLVA